MKGIVAYYSAGGNTHKIARAIYRGMKEVIECDVGMVNDLDPKDMDKYDLIGIGSPLWYFRETANVRRFVYYMPDMKGKLGFVFCAHGTLPSGMFHAMVPPIQRKGVTIIGWNDWFGTNFSGISNTKPNPVDGHPDEVDIKEAEDWGREMAEHARRIYIGEKKLIPEIPRGPNAPPLFQPHGVMRFFGGLEKPRRSVNMDLCKYPECTLCIDNCAARNALDFSVNPPAYNMKTCLNCCLCDRMCPQGAIEIPEEDERLMRTKYAINMEKCKYPGCTICVDHCSMDAIDFSVKPPVFKRSCEGDHQCFMICPQGAIGVTNFDVTHGAGHGESRSRPTGYVDMLDKLEEQGLFRRLVPKEELGTGMKPIDITRYPIYDIHDLMQETPLPKYYGVRYTDSKE